MELSRWVLKIEALLLLGAFILAWLPPPRAWRAATLTWWASALAGGVYAGLRYWMTWPMTPMFASGVLFAPLLVPLGALALRHTEDPACTVVIHRALIGSGLIVVVLGVCFPKDFYLPIIKTASPYAHGVLLFGALGRACLLLCAAWGIAVLSGCAAASSRLFQALTWGFGCWTLSLFSGEVWSYSGWGVPVVWEDPSTLTAIATWFFGVGLIHLYLVGLFSPRIRAALAVLVGVLVLTFNGGPDLGPFRNPFTL